MRAGANPAGGAAGAARPTGAGVGGRATGATGATLDGTVVAAGLRGATPGAGRSGRSGRSGCSGRSGRAGDTVLVDKLLLELPGRAGGVSWMYRRTSPRFGPSTGAAGSMFFCPCCNCRTAASLRYCAATGPIGRRFASAACGTTVIACGKRRLRK